MTADEWQHLQALLIPLLEAEVADRKQLLDVLCAGDEVVRARLLALLAHEHALPSLPTDLVREWARMEEGDQWIGRRVGAFVIEERLGSGGSSVVFRARRVSDFSQEVAIKLLRSTAADTLLARFLREREILATLHHPHIAQLYDAGSSEDGTPYLVLEYVDGLSWDRWLRDKQPDIVQVLEQFLRICDAVRHAHQRLLVHRDIKPSNLIVDQAGTPRLLDFGIAKLLSESDAGALTRELGTSFTPAYAAPEQISGAPVTTATDVYALGVLLYESLSGRHPFRQPGDTEQQVLRAVVDLEAGKPSEADRNSILAHAGKGLRADLDNIVLTAMEKDPMRRYAGVNEFADDIRAALDGKPIRARTHTWRYLAGKFVRRHRLPVGIATLALLLVLVASAAALWQAGIALRERTMAERRFEQVRQFTHAMLFDYHEGIQKLPGSLPMQKRLVEDSRAYLMALQNEAGDDASIWEELAEAWIKTGNLQGNPYVANLGDFDGAARSYALADAAITHLPRDASSTRDFLLARLRTYQAHVDHQNGALESARDKYKQSLAIYDAMPAAIADGTEVRLEHADTLDYLGDLLGRDGQNSLMQIELARSSYLAAAGLRNEALTDEPENPQIRYAVYKSTLREGEYLAGQGDMVRAEVELLAAQKLIEQLYQDEPENSYRHREVALVHATLVPIQDALDKIAASTDNALSAVRIMDAMLKADPDNDSMRQGLVASCGWAARQLIKSKRFNEAAPIIERQIEVNLLRLEDAPGNADIEYSLSLAYRRLGEQQAALEHFAEAIATHRKALDLQEHVRTLGAEYALSHALSLMHVGRSQLALGDAAEAQASLDEAVRRVTALIAEYPEATRYLSVKAELLEGSGDARKSLAISGTDSAAARYRQAVSSWDAYAALYPLSPAESRQRDAVIEKIAASR